MIDMAYLALDYQNPRNFYCGNLQSLVFIEDGWFYSRPFFMEKISIFLLFWHFLCCGVSLNGTSPLFSQGEGEYNPVEIESKVIGEIKLPKGYHEGLFLQDGKVWVNNGEKGNTWVIITRSAS